MSSVPTTEDFAARGLTEVELDGPRPSSVAATTLASPSTVDRESRLTGRALFRPTRGYPPSRRGASMLGADGTMRVRFRVAPASNPAGDLPSASALYESLAAESGLEGSMSKLTVSRPASDPALDHFQRNHQLLAALFGPQLCSDEEQPTSPRPDGRSSSPSPTFSSLGEAPVRSPSLQPSSRNPLASAPSAPLPPPKPSFLPYVDRIVGWWEDGFGGWMIGPDDEQSTSLHDHWTSLLEGETRMEDLAISDRDQTGKRVMDAYGNATEMLIQVADILQSLNDRRLALAVARPDFFHVNMRPTDRRLPPQVELIRVATCVQLPGFDWDNISTPVPHQSPSFGNSVGSPLAAVSSPERGRSSAVAVEEGTATMRPSRTARDADGDAGGLYEEKLLKKHLRYLAPETVSSRRVSPVGDVFSFGVLAYELIVGRSAERNDGTEVDLLSDIHRHLTVDLQSPLAVLRSSNAPPGESATPVSPTSAQFHPRRPLPPKELSDIVMKCLAKDLDERYGSIRSLSFDLRRFRDVCRAEGDLSRFKVGQVDDLSKFRLPQSLISRVTETESLDRAFASIRGKPDVGVTGAVEGVSGRGGNGIKIVNVYGLSGSGKSKMVEVWAKKLESRAGGQGVLVGTAKLDQHLRKPLAGFIQLIQSLLDRIFSDPKEDAQAWRTKILHALSSQGSVFLSIISPEWRAVLLPESDASDVAKPASSSDWELFLPGFRVWSKQLLQLFATRDRPLVIILDDIQWLAAEELQLWQDILASPLNPFENVLLVSLFRVDEDAPPPSAALLSKSSQTVKIDRFQESSVADFLRTCFHWPADDGVASNLASFLWTETQGSPFYLRSLVTTMVRERVIAFSFDLLRWTVDFTSLQLHTSEGVDAYLDRTLSALPENVQQLLRVLACLPSAGFPIGSLAELVGFEGRLTETLLQPAALTGAVFFPDEGTVRFSHDRNQAAAYRLLRPDDRGRTHAKIATYLQQPSHLEEHLFDAVDNELLAHEFGVETDDRDALVKLICHAAQRAARSASYTQARVYLDSVDRIVDFADPPTWARLRPTGFSFLELSAEVAAVLRTSDAAVARIRTMMVLCRTRLEQLTMRTLIIRLLIAGAKYADAVEESLDAIRRAGYDPISPSTELLARVPQTPAELDSVLAALDTDEGDRQSMEHTNNNDDDDDLVHALLLLCGYVGPSTYVCSLPEVRTPFFTFAIALALGSRSTLSSDASAYVSVVYSIAVVADMEMRKSWVELSTRLAKPGSYFECAGIVVGLFQSHGWIPLDELDFVPSFDEAMSTLNTDLATYILCLCYQTRLLGRNPFSAHLPAISNFYGRAIEAVTPGSRVLIDIALQAGDQLGGAEPSADEPWNLDGAFLRSKDYELVKDFPMHSVVWWSSSLRLAFLFGAPRSTLADLYAKTCVHRHAVPGLVVELEVLLVITLFAILHGDDADQADAHTNTAEIARHGTIDYAARIKLLSVARSIRTATDAGGSAWTAVLVEAETRLAELLADGFNLLAGLASSLVADFLSAALPGLAGERLATGYVRTAHQAYVACEAVAVARRLQQKWPAAFAPLGGGPTPTLPSHVLTVTPQALDPALVRPPLLPAPNSNTTEDSTAPDTTGSMSSREDESAGSSSVVDSLESLDNLTFMRSSLLLASEKDPEVLVVTLIRILCQFVRADYGAIALVDSSTGSLRLRGAGPYSRLSSFDLDFSHPDACTVAPTSLLLHVNRTRRSITSVGQLQKLRQDPFYGDRLPRSILVLSLQQQGREVGVLLLSSKTVVTPTSALAQVTEVVSCLATFAAIALESSQSTAKLESQVKERTAKLQDALAAKTSFLANMSHELRTPLFAVLGLAAVLEDSPGLNSVQREHLATIRTSGEDLQTLISNVLDFSRLESGSLHASQLESIPFSLRDVIENTLDSVSTIAQRKGVELVVATAVSTVPPYQLVGDPFRVKQIVTNLAANSVKFTSHGSVAVSWEVVQRDDSHSLVSVFVKDTGLGIPPQKLDRLFKSFSQIDSSITRSYGGSGLGLAISQQLAKLLGGSCSATSAGVGSGSTFTFSFVASHTPRISTPFPIPRTTRSAFILAPEAASRTVLHDNLVGFGFAKVHAAATVALATTETDTDSLGSSVYDVVLVLTAGVSKAQLDELHNLQRAAKFIYLTRSIDLSDTIDRLAIAHSAIVPCAPTKTKVLFAALADTRAGAPARPKKTSAIDPDLARRHPLSILVVDDSSINLSVGTKILERFGFTTIVTACDGQQALDACEKTRFSLVLMDLQMPVMDGYEASKQIALSPLAGKPIVVALSANTDDRTRQLVDSTGFFAYLTKPLVISNLARVLVDAHQALESRKSLAALPPVSSTAEGLPSPSKRARLELPLVDGEVTESLS